MNINYDIKELSIKELLSLYRYEIPLYQRNYDWGDREAIQLVEDIAEYAKHRPQQNYYIGSVVVFPRVKSGGGSYYEVIDGQQRLTTLTILATLIRKRGLADWFATPNISYSHRADADEAISKMNDEKFEPKPAGASIRAVYKILDKTLNDVDIDCFAQYLFEKVRIIHIPVPHDTELNHYFEIMNSRGEQLEKHEVLKAALMEPLSKEEHMLFNEIWEACSDMNSYVQMNFAPSVREMLFGNSWSKVPQDDFDTYCKQRNLTIQSAVETDDAPLSLQKLYEEAKANKSYALPMEDNLEHSERFGSVINFQNFLLHALKIMFHHETNYSKDLDSKLTLDDKHLLSLFDSVLAHNKDDKAGFVRRFIMSLLRLRMNFDMFIIKREYLDNAERWSIKKIKKTPGQNKAYYVATFSKNNAVGVEEDDNDNGRDIKMLESMFHVSAPTQIYKHWLNACLFYLYDKSELNPSDFRSTLYRLACTYMLDRYLCNKKVEFENIIYQTNGTFDAENSIDDINWENIDNGCGVQNFIFNFYDYVQWRTDQNKYPKFEFSYRSSVEHFYPRVAMEGYKNLDKNVIDKFGNLCLISRSMNSKFSNNMPIAKYANFGQTQEVRDGLSIKLLEMMDVIKEYKNWDENSIYEFEEKAKEIIKNAIIAGAKNSLF